MWSGIEAKGAGVGISSLAQHGTNGREENGREYLVLILDEENDEQLEEGSEQRPDQGEGLGRK